MDSNFRFRASGDTPHRPRGEAASHRSRLPLRRDLSAGGGSLLRTRLGNGARKSGFLGTPTGSWTLFPRRSAYLSDCYYEYFSNAGIAMVAALPVYKKRGGSTRSNLFKTSGFLANYGSKPIDIGGLGHDHQSGILWSAYPIKLWALGPPSVSSSDAEKARRNPPTRGASPPGASDPQEKRGDPSGSL